MSETLIKELLEENLCTHFVLPLLKLSKFSFISSNFINCYLTQDGLKVSVFVVEPMLLSRKVSGHRNYIGSYRNTDPGTHIVFTIPQHWFPDVQLFMQGKFSLMSDSCKEMIRRFSRLEHRVRKSNGNIETDGRLLALDRHPVIRDMWERKLSCSTGSQRSIVEISEDAELLSIPEKKSYINLDGLVRI